MWYMVFLDASGDEAEDFVDVQDHEPTQHELELDMQMVGAYLGGVYGPGDGVDSSDQALVRAREEFDGWGGCVS